MSDDKKTPFELWALFAREPLLGAMSDARLMPFITLIPEPMHDSSIPITRP